MLYLATGSDPAVIEQMSSGALGLIITPNDRRRSAHPDGVRWAADNGCYSPRNWTVERWWSWLVSERPNAGRCIFATAPDVVGNWPETVAQARPWLARIQTLGYPAALVLQDGATLTSVPWGSFDVVFVGGSTEWKLGSEAADLVTEARRRGVQVHMGRVNSRRRWRYAEALGCSTVDGTFLAFGPAKNLPRLLSWTASSATLFSAEVSA